MKIAYFGSHDLGVHTLKESLKKGMKISLVISPKIQDPWYRGVKETAESQNIEVLEAISGRDEKVYRRLKEKEIDMVFLVNYPYVISGDLLSDKTIQIFNMHASLLPQYRGRAPLNWAMLCGEKEVGVSLHKVVQGIDAGDILIQQKVPVFQKDYIGDVLNRVKDIYPAILWQAKEMLEEGRVSFLPQGEGSYYGKREKADGEIFLDWSGEKIMRYIKALSKPYPGAFLTWKEERIILWRGAWLPEGQGEKEVPYEKNHRLIIPLKKGVLNITDWSVEPI